MAEDPNQKPLYQWAIVSLMGHSQTAGRIDFDDGLIRVDVPDGDTWQTRFFGRAAIFSIDMVSEEIARAYARRPVDIVAYDAPIITRDQHQQVVHQLEMQNTRLEHQVGELERRLIAIDARQLPAPETEESDED